MPLQRPDDFATRRKHLANLTDEELFDRFWELANKIVEPLVELSRTHTSPSVERSVLLRMGFSSLEAKAIVDKVMEKGLLGKGAGHVVLKAAALSGLPYREAGLALAEGKYWDEIEALWKGGQVS